MEVEEAQNRLTELKQQLLFKKSQVSDAKAELDHKSRSIQEINKYLSNYCFDMSRNKRNRGTIIMFILKVASWVLLQCVSSFLNFSG